MTTTLSRRDMLKNTLTVGAGLCFPWSLAQASPSPMWVKWPPTEADLALVRTVRRFTKVTRIRVHPLLHKHMSINHIGGIEVEVADFQHGHATLRGNISYYYVTNLPTDNGIVGHSCEYPADRIEEWAHLNAFSREFVPLSFSDRKGVS